MNDEASRSGVPREGRREPYRVRLPGFVSEEDVGLGDTIKRATSTVGIRPCGGCGRIGSTSFNSIGGTGRRPR